MVNTTFMSGLLNSMMAGSKLSTNTTYKFDLETNSFSFILHVPESITLPAIYFSSSMFAYLAGITSERSIQGGEEATLTITNPGKQPIIVDFSVVTITGFGILNIAENVTVIVDQEDVADIDAILGDGVLRASGVTGALDLQGKIIGVDVQNSVGELDDAHGGDIIDGDFTSGEPGNDQYNGTEFSDHYNGMQGDDSISGSAGDDYLYGGEGNDTIRGGSGLDEMYGGEGDDHFVIVGDLTAGGKVDTPEDTSVLGQKLSSLNGVDLNEDEDGAAEVISGGSGWDTLKWTLSTRQNKVEFKVATRRLFMPLPVAAL